MTKIRLSDAASQDAIVTMRLPSNQNINHMETTEKNIVQESIVELLEKAKQELAEFRDELDLEKTELSVKFHDLRAEIKATLFDIRKLLEHDKQIGTDQARAILKKVNALDEQLADSGKQITEDIKDHLLNLRKPLSEVVHACAKQGLNSEPWALIHDRFQRLRIKLEILRLKLKLGKMEIKDRVREEYKDLNEKIARLRSYVHSKKKGWGKFKMEITEAYTHLQKAFS